MRDLLPNILATLTRCPRHEVRVGRDFEWNPNSWLYNAFRVWELVFGRKMLNGSMIRFEGAMSKALVEDKWITTYEFGTFENLAVFIEGGIRAFLKKPILGFKLVPVPQMVLVGGPNMPVFYRFAIADDTSATVYNGAQASNVSGAYTTTGSNAATFGYNRTSIGSDTCTAMSYSSAMTRIGTNVCPTDRGFTIFHVEGVTGSNTLGMTGSNCILLRGISFSGVKQSWAGSGGGGSDASNTGSTSGPGNLTVSITVVAANCWIFTCADPGVVAVSGTATYYCGESSAGFDVASSGGTVTTGSQSVVTNQGGGVQATIIFSFAPATAAGPTNVKTFDGVTQSTGVKTYFGVALASTKTVDGIS